MKKLSIITFMFLLTLVGCSSEDNSAEILQLSRGENTSFTPKELDSFGSLHSRGLTYVINEFQNELNISNNQFRTINNEIDTIALLNFVKQRTAIFLDDKTVAFKGVDYAATKGYAELDFIDLKFVRNLDNFSVDNSKSPLFNSLIAQIDKSLFETSSYEDLEQRLNSIINTARINITSETELTIILATSAVVKDSYKYWYEPIGFQGKSDSPKKGRYALALADGTGLYQGAIWGGVAAGPLGAVVVGINAAIISSSVAYLLGQV